MLEEEANIPHLRQLLKEIGDELYVRVRRRRVMNAENLETGIRVTVVRKLVSAIDEVEALAKKAGRRGWKGGGGISPKIRWYQLMAYLAQTLDGVLKNSDMEQFRDKLEEVERVVEKLQRTSQGAN